MSAITLTYHDNGTVELCFDLPGEKVNKLSTATLTLLQEHLDAIEGAGAARALVITSGKEGVFIAGADLDELKEVSTVEGATALSTQGHTVFNTLERLPIPTFAVINGTCLGGGLELALACDYRIVTDSPKVQLGLPEVQLGIIPGWGGTQRLPRLIGLAPAMKMILSGKPVDGKKAYKMKLADAIATPAFLKTSVDTFIDGCVQGGERKKVRKRRSKRGLVNTLIDKIGILRRYAFHSARKELMNKTKGHYPAPLKAVDVLEETFAHPPGKGNAKEIQAVASLVESPISRNLIQLFFTGEAIKKEGNSHPEGIKKIGVIGAGVMGGGIAWAFSNRGYPVRLKDLTWNAIAKGYETAHNMYQQLIKIRKLTPAQATQRFHHISGGLDDTGFQDVDCVVEAVVENMDVKKEVLAGIEKKVSPSTILCSNTSSLSITEMAADLEHPERVVGLHFFNPVNRMPLVEVIPGEKTSKEVVDQTVALVKSLKKIAVVVKNCPGFLVNRILLPCLHEAGWMFEEGVSIERIDTLLTQFGLPMGPFVLADEVGIDVATKVSKILEEGYGPRMKMPAVFGKVVEKELFGKKTGKGFYIHKKPRVINRQVVKMQKEERSRGSELTDQQVVDRAILVMVNEAARCLEEGVIETPHYLDLAIIYGTGFPPFRGGLLRYADQRGVDRVADTLDELSKRHGERFVPCDLLVRMREEGKQFYQ